VKLAVTVGKGLYDAIPVTPNKSFGFFPRTREDKGKTSVESGWEWTSHADCELGRRKRQAFDG
jgi:hypothetical protein